MQLKNVMKRQMINVYRGASLNFHFCVTESFINHCSYCKTESTMGNASHKIIGNYVMNSRHVILLLDNTERLKTVERIWLMLFYSNCLWWCNIALRIAKNPQFSM